MRAFGLLFLLAGCLLLMWPMLSGLLHIRFRIPDNQMLGGLLLMLGVIALVLTRNHRSP